MLRFLYRCVLLACPSGSTARLAKGMVVRTSVATSMKVGKATGLWLLASALSSSPMP